MVGCVASAAIRILQSSSAGEDDGHGRGRRPFGVFDRDAECLGGNAFGQLGQHYAGRAMVVGAEESGGNRRFSVGRDHPEFVGLAGRNWLQVIADEDQRALLGEIAGVSGGRWRALAFSERDLLRGGRSEGVEDFLCVGGVGGEVGDLALVVVEQFVEPLVLVAEIASQRE